MEIIRNLGLVGKSLLSFSFDKNMFHLIKIINGCLCMRTFITKYVHSTLLLANFLSLLCKYVDGVLDITGRHLYIYSEALTSVIHFIRT